MKIRRVSDQPAATPERPGRYNRSFGGLIAAMIATVVFVSAYIGFRALFRDQPDIRPDVDYLACAAYLQAADETVVYPRELPEGWRSTSVAYERGTPATWRVGLVTDGDEFVGVVQQQADVEDLLDTYVDESADAGDDASPENSLGVASWQTWSDSGGDHAFSTELTSGPLEGRTILVYGSAPVADQEELLGLLTTDPAGAGVDANGCNTDEL